MQEHGARFPFYLLGPHKPSDAALLSFFQQKLMIPLSLHSDLRRPLDLQFRHEHLGRIPISASISELFIGICKLSHF